MNMFMNMYMYMFMNKVVFLFKYFDVILNIVYSSMDELYFKT